VTMAIAASLMGLGAGLFMSMGKRTAEPENALASISSMVINVRNASSRFPAMISVVPSTKDNPGEIRWPRSGDPPGASLRSASGRGRGPDADRRRDRMAETATSWERRSSRTSAVVGARCAFRAAMVDCGKLRAVRRDRRTHRPCST